MLSFPRRRESLPFIFDRDSRLRGNDVEKGGNDDERNERRGNENNPENPRSDEVVK